MHIFDRLRIGSTTNSAEDTQTLAEELALALPADTTLALHGDLGVGKTTFVQGLARGFGVHEQVTSPTFNIYTIHRSAQRTLIHLDAYRLESGREVEDLLLEDFLVSPWCLAVEWPEKIADWMPSNALHLRLGINADQQHTIQLSSTTA